MYNTNNNVIINKEFYDNIPLDNKTNISQILNDIKNLQCHSLNYDYINNKLIIDENINKEISNNIDKNLYEEEDNEDSEHKHESFDSFDKEMDKEDLKEKELINDKLINYKKNILQIKKHGGLLKVFMPVKNIMLIQIIITFKKNN